MRQLARLALLFVLLLPLGPAAAQPQTVTLTPVRSWGRGVINDVQFSADGAYFAVATPTGIYLHETAAPPDTEPVHIAPGVPVERVALSPDAQYIAAVSPLAEPEIHLYGRDGERILPFDAVAYAGWPLSFSPDGATLMTVDSDGNLLTYDAQTGTLASSLSIATHRWIEVPQFSADGRYVSIFSNSRLSPVDGIYGVWRTQPLEQIASFDSPEGETNFAVSADGAFSAWVDPGLNVHIYDMATGEERPAPPAPAMHYGYVFAVGAHRLAYNSVDGFVVWNMDASAERRVSGQAAGARLGPDDTLVYWMDDGRMRVMSRRGDTVAIDGYSGDVAFATAHPFDEAVVTISQQRGLAAWDVASGTFPAAGSATTPDFGGETLAQLVYFPMGIHAVGRWPTAAPEVIGGCCFDRYGKLHDIGTSIYDIDVVDDFEFVTASERGVFFYDGSGSETAILPRTSSDHPPLRVFAMPDGKSVVILLDIDGDATGIWHVSMDGTPILRTGVIGQLDAAALAPDGSSIALMTKFYQSDRKFTVVDVTTNDRLYEQALPVTGQFAYGAGIAYSPDGSLLALAYGGTLTVYDASTFDVAAEVAIPQSRVTALTFTASGRHLAVFQSGGLGTVYEIARP